MQFLKKKQHLKAVRMICSCLCVLMAVSLSGCAAAQETSTGTAAESEGQPLLKITTADRTTEYADPVEILLDEQEKEVRIEQGGTYLLTGTLDGSIRVDAEEQIVHLILHDAVVNSVEGPALYVQSAGKVILTVPEGTINTLQDSGAYSASADADACIYSECDLTINGAGLLNVHGYYKDAVHSKDVLKVLGGSLFVQSKRDGLRGNDGLLLSCSDVTVQSERNGLSTMKTGKPGKGNMEILAGEHSVIGGNYAINCAQDLHMRDCSMYLIGVVGHMEVGGQQYVEDGCLTNE